MNSNGSTMNSIAWVPRGASTHGRSRNLGALVVALNDDPAWWFTGVYGPHRDDEKLGFIEELREVRANCPGPWMQAGDFNMIYCSEDKNNENINRAMMGRFRHFVNDLELKEIPLLCRRYTWSNERDSPTPVKLDRVLCTNDWEEIYADNVL